MKKYTLGFLLYGLLLFALSAQADTETGKDSLIREDWLRDNAVEELFPPFDSEIESSLLYTPNLELDTADYRSTVFSIIPDPVSALEFNIPQETDIFYYLLPGIGYKSSTHINLSLSGMLDFFDLNIQFNALCETADWLFPGTLTEPFKYALDCSGIKEWDIHVLDVKLFTGFTFLTQPGSTLLFALQGDYNTFPGRIHLSDHTELNTLLIQGEQEVYNPVYLRESVSLSSLTREDLPRFSGDLALIYEPTTGHREWLSRISIKKDFIGLNDTMYATATGSLFAGDDFLLLVPEFMILYRKAELDLTFNLQTFSEGDGGSMSADRRGFSGENILEKLLDLHPADYTPSLDRGLLSSMSAHYTYSDLFQVSTALFFYTGRWNFVEEDVIINSALTDLDLVIDSSLHLAPGILDFDFRCSVIQGLLFNVNRHIVTGELGILIKNLPLALILNLDWVTAPSVASSKTRYLPAAGNMGIKIQYEQEKRLLIEAGAELNFDKNLIFLDYDIFFSICFYLNKE